MPDEKNVTKKFAEPSSVTSQTPSLQKDEWLTNFSVGFRDNRYVTDVLIPELAVKKDSAKYRVVSPKGRFKGAAKRAETALPQQAALQYSEDTYTAEEYALEGWVSDDAIRNAADDIQPLADEAEYLTGKIQLTEEILRVTEIFDAIKAGGTDYYTLLTAATKWDGGASADILGDLSTAIKTISTNIGIRPNVASLDTTTYEVVLQDSEVSDILRRNGSAVLTDATPINTLRGLRLLIADAVVNIGTQESASYSNILYDVDVSTAFKQTVVVAYANAADKLTIGRNFVPKPFLAFRGRGLEGDRRQATLVYVAKKLAPKVTNIGAAYAIAKVLG